MTRRHLLRATPAAALAASAQTQPIDIGSRRELMADRYLIDRLTNAELRLAQPYDAGTVLRLDRPWEGRFSNYVTILQDGGTYRLYYRGVPSAGSDGRDSEVTCYAESKDGIHFARPDLEIHEVHGTRRNNVIQARTAPLQHNFCPFLDTRRGAGSRYKALAGTSRGGLIAFQSDDGIRWRKMREEPVLTKGAFDSQNLAFWSESEGAYLCYFRTFKDIGKQRYRWISRAVSQDFLNWEYQGEMSFGDAPPEHLYTNQTSPYFRAPHLYVSICARFLPGRQVLSEQEARSVNVDPAYFKDCSDAVFLTSRGGTRYDRTFLDAFLRPGLGYENWVSRSNYPALNVVPTGANEMSFYVVRNYGQPSIYLRRYTLRTDGFASVHAGYSGGEMITKPLVFRGSNLAVNYSTSAPGGIRIELREPDSGKVLAESAELIGDQVERTVSWQGGEGIGQWAGRPVRMRVQLKDADLYAFRFV